MIKHQLKAQENDKGLRIDQFLSQHIEALSRNQARKALQRGGVYVGRRRLKICSYRIRGHEKVAVYIPEPGELLSQVTTEETLVDTRSEPTEIPPALSEQIAVKDIPGLSRRTVQKGHKNLRLRGNGHTSEGPVKRQPKKPVKNDHSTPITPENHHKQKQRPVKQETKKPVIQVHNTHATPENRHKPRPVRQETKQSVNHDHIAHISSENYRIAVPVRPDIVMQDKLENKASIPPLKEIIFIDKNIIAVNKPSGLASQPTRSSDVDTVVHLLTTYLTAIGENNSVSLIHRLDQNCSGLMVFGRNKTANKSLTQQFKDHTIQKNYLAVVSGNSIEKERDTLTMTLAEPDKTARNANDEQPELTMSLEYEVLERFHGFSWLKITPHTGKTHQIRQQLASIGAPIIGDTQYGGQSMRDFIVKFSHRPLKIDEQRFMLHSYCVILSHPTTMQLLEMVAPIPDDMKEILSVLREVASW